MKLKTKRLIVIFVSLVFMFTLIPANAFAAWEGADSVYLNGNIYTVDNNFSKATALVIKGQTLIYVGSDKKAKAYVGTNTKVVDLKGKTVVPGLIEGHMHVSMLGENLIKIDAFYKSKEDILKAVKEQADRLPAGEWINGFGWNNEVWADKSFPSKEDLDKVAPNNPVIMERVDSHMLWVNSKALELAGITKDSKNPQGGEILRDSSGNPTGCLTDTATEPVKNLIPPLSQERKKEALLKAQDQLFSYGFTSAMNAGTTISDMNNIKDLYKDQKLNIRLYAMIGGAWGEKPGENALEYYKTGPEIGLFGNRLTARTIKLFADGSLGSRSAALLDDYSDRPGHKGNLKYTDEELYQEVKQAREHGFQVATHAIGDAAVNQVLNAYERVLKEEPLNDHRYRIEHFQVATLADIKRAAELKVIPAMQPTHATSDKNMAEDRLGHERIQGAYAWRKVIDAGSIIVGGSDAPVELVNPFHGLYAAVTRMDRQGNPPEGWYAEECMTRTEALKSFTIWAAYGQFEENIKGSLEKGKLADFAVLDRDVMTCPVSDIKDTNALMTVLGGEVVYERPVSKDINVTFKGDSVKLSQGAINDKGVIYAPAQDLFNAMGVKYSFEKNTNKFTASSKLTTSRDSVKISGKVGDKKIIINGFETNLTSPLKLINGTVYVPVDFAAKSFGYLGTFYKDSNTMSITF